MHPPGEQIDGSHQLALGLDVLPGDEQRVGARQQRGGRQLVHLGEAVDLRELGGGFNHASFKEVLQMEV